MANFCKGPIWNISLSWNTNNPNLTPCLRDSVLPALPCGLLWMMLPLWYFWLTRYYQPKLKAKVNWKGRLTFIFISKMALNYVILFNSVGELLWRSKQGQQGWSDLYGSDVFYPVCIFISSLLAMVMVLAEKIHLIRSSVALSFFWPLLTLSCIPNTKVEVELLLEDNQYDRLILTATFVPVCCLLSLLNLYPDINDLEQSADLAPNNTNSFFSAVFLSWMTPLIWKGYKSPLSQKDLFNVPMKVNVDENVEKFQVQWNQYLKKNSFDFAKNGKVRQRANLWTPLIKTLGLRFLFANLLGLVHYSVQLLGPQVLKQLIDHIEKPQDYAWRGYFYSALLFVIYFINAIFFHNYLNQMYSIAIMARSIVMSSIMRKTLKLSNIARKKFTIGQITNMVSVDSQRLLEATPYLAILWAAPYQTTVGMILVYNELGYAALAGVAVLAILIPINAIGSKIGEMLQRSQLKAKDSRIKLMNEILAGIKVLKLYAWEIPFMKRILKTRDQELNVIKKYGILTSWTNFTFTCSPILITISAFSAYALSGHGDGHVLTPQKVFVSIAYFNLIRVPLMLLPLTLREVIKMYVSLKRITDFLNAEELDQDCITYLQQTENNSIEVNEATFTWEETSKPNLKGLSFNIPKGSLTAVVGSVGSGKSSLLSAILGEMHHDGSKIARQGSMAYVAQQAWIQNLTVRDNILFGNDFYPDKYDEIIEGCCLKPDLKILVKGDATEIGENGINLSGGQKQRVNLARAVYSDSDVVLLDDPLSAVDAHVGKHIFDKIISNDNASLLAKKTRIWVTNHLSYLPYVDQIIVMNNGSIVEQGTFKELMTSSNSKILSHLIHDTAEKENKQTTSSNSTAEPVKSKITEPLVELSHDSGKLIKDESAKTGRVKSKIYLSYFKSLSYFSTVMFICLIALQESLYLAGNLWLAHWSDDEAGEHSVSYYLWGYAIIGMCGMATKLVNDLVYYFRCARASKIIHKNLLDNVMRSPMRFFDTNPTGRIMNRFTTDLDTIDQMIPSEFLEFSWSLIECMVVILLICVTTPAFIGVVIPLLFIYFYLQRIYIASSRQLKRLYSISKSPIFSHFTETTQGAQTIRAYGAQERFIQELQNRLSTNVTSVYLNLMSNRCTGVTLKALFASPRLTLPHFASPCLT